MVGGINFSFMEDIVADFHSRVEENSWAVASRPFLDLGSSKTGALFVHRVEYDAQDMMSAQDSHVDIQLLMPRSFRQQLTREARLPRYNIQNPLELPEELTTERWCYLNDQLKAFKRLTSKVQIRTAKLLLSLGFHPLIRNLIPKYAPAAIASCKETAVLALIYAIAGGSGSHFKVSEYTDIALNAPRGHLARVKAGIALIVNAVKVKQDAGLASQWSEHVKDACSGSVYLDDFQRYYTLSRVYRATAFAPYLHAVKGEESEKKFSEMVLEMDLAEEHARYLVSIAGSDKESLVARENLMTVLLSRVKEAIALGDLDLAEVRCREMARCDQLDPRNFMELGNILSRRGKTKEALDAYRRASLLGPPETPAARFMMGKHLEVLGWKEAAADCYLQVLQVDPLGYSAAQRLYDLTRALGWSAMANWSLERIEAAFSRRPQPSRANQ